MKIIVLLANGFEEVEAITLIDLLRRAQYDVTTVSISETKEVCGGHNIPIIADALLSNKDFKDYDALILPGGVPGVPNLAADERVIELVKRYNNDSKFIGAICAAPYVLDHAGILKGKNITCYPSWAPKIKDAQIFDKPVEVDGKIITGNGVGGAIAMALKLVEVFSSKEESEDLAEKILYEK